MKNLLKSIGYILYYFAFQILIQIILAKVVIGSGLITEADLLQWTIDNILLIITLSNLLSISVLTLISKPIRSLLSREVLLKQVSFKEYLLPVMSAFSLSIFFTLITSGIEIENSVQISQSATYFSQIRPWLGNVMMIVALLISAPITEEFLCRGVIITLLRQNWSSTTAILISALLFGGMHIMSGGLILAVLASLMGGLFGFIFVKTKSLLPAIAAHSAANLSDFILPVISQMNKATYVIITIAFLIIFVMCMVPLCKDIKTSAYEE